jgi:hypothetical protein
MAMPPHGGRESHQCRARGCAAEIRPSGNRPARADGPACTTPLLRRGHAAQKRPYVSLVMVWSKSNSASPPGFLVRAPMPRATAKWREA